MPEICSCIQCGKEFKVKPYKKDTAKFCSKECHGKYKKGKRKGEWVTKICPSCGKEFETLKSKEKKYCSQQCNKDRNENYINYNCDCCGKEIRIKKSNYQKLLDGKQKSITCSYECAWKMKNNGSNTTCHNCGKIIYRTQYRMNKQEHQFCSNECQMEYQHRERYEIRKCEIWFNDRSRKILEVDLVKENRCCPIGMRGLDMFGNVSELEVRFPMLNWKKDLKKMFRKIERILNKREYQI